MLTILLAVSGHIKAYTSSIPVSLTVPTASLEVSGYASPGALVTIYDGANPTATVSANPLGFYTKLIPTLSSGLHSISVSQKDVTGLESSSVSKIVNIAPQQLTQLEFASPPTVRLIAPTLTEGQTQTITGYSEPGKIVHLFIDNSISPSQTVISGSDGFYSFTVNTTGFYDGNHFIKTRTESSLGITEYSKMISFTIKKKPISNEPSNSQPNKPAVAGGSRPEVPVISDPPSKTSIDGNKVIIKGQSKPNSQIVISVNGQVVGSVFSNNVGEWIFEYYPKVSKNVVTAIACYDGECSQPSDPIEIYYRVQGATDCKGSYEIQNYRFSVSDNKEVKLQTDYNLDIAKTLLIDWGDGDVEKFSVSADRKYDYFEHLYSLVGRYNGQITLAYENDECAETKYFTVNVVKDGFSKLDNRVLLVIILSLILALLLSLRDRYQREISFRKITKQQR